MVQFRATVLEKLSNQGSLLADDKKDLRIDLFHDLLHNLNINFDILERHNNQFGFCAIDTFKEFFIQYHTQLTMLYTLPVTTHPKGSHLWCVHFFKNMCKGLKFEMIRLNNDTFCLKHKANEICKDDGKTLTDVLRT